MIRELGHCSGIENYSRYFDGSAAGTRPYCLLDFFPDDFPDRYRRKPRKVYPKSVQCTEETVREKSILWNMVSDCLPLWTIAR